VSAPRSRRDLLRRAWLLAPLGLALAGYALVVSASDQLPKDAARAEAAGFGPGGLAAVDMIVEQAVRDHAFPGAVLAVGREGRLVHLRAFGRMSSDAGASPVATDTVYDLASLTKVVATTTIAMVLVDEGRLDLDQRVSAFFPAFRGGNKDRVTVRQLLSHSGGLLWWAPLYKELKGKAAYLDRITALPLDYEPGTKSVYSDLGAILLGDIVERQGGAPLDELTRRLVTGPLGMTDTLFLPPATMRDRIAPTERDPWRGRLLQGEVHDENASALGGVAPHAGLFSSAPDLARFAQMLLDEGVFEGRRIVSRATVELFSERAGVPHSSRALGWDTPTDGSGVRSSVPGQPGYSSAGSLFSPRSFGHTGFTGTSIWMDPERQLYVILLTNRVNPTRENNAIRAVRAQVADGVVRALARP
jgi:CubicO group peptidase (beta-lactamase class C family)